MNKDQLKGVIKEAAGKVQEKIGEVTGSATQQAKGLAKEKADVLRRRRRNKFLAVGSLAA